MQDISEPVRKYCRRNLLWLLAAAISGLTTTNGQAQNPSREPQHDIQVMLVKNAITAVNHGNLTGNYTVLRDLGARAFREGNSAARLATTFERLREQKADLSPVLVLEPQFTETPSISGDGRLSLVGYFPTQPLRVHFRLTFQWESGGWSIDSLGIGTAATRE